MLSLKFIINASQIIKLSAVTSFPSTCAQSSLHSYFTEMHAHLLRVLVSSVKHYKMGRPRTFNYWQSIFVAIAIGAAGATHKVICSELFPPLFPSSCAVATIDYYTIASEYGALFIPLNYAMIDRIDFRKFTPQNCGPTEGTAIAFVLSATLRNIVHHCTGVDKTLRLNK